jgi:hypothetical protein
VRGIELIEVLMRLGLALLLSLSLAVLMAWGWHSSDRAQLPADVVSSASTRAGQPAIPNP